MRMRHIFIRGMAGSRIFFHITPQTIRFSKKNIIEYKMCIVIFSASFIWNVSLSKNNLARYDKKCILVFM